MTTTKLLSSLMLVLGVVMLVSTVARGGGPLAQGVVLGIGFCAAGAGRLWMASK